MYQGLLLGIPINGESFEATLKAFENIISNNKANKKSSYIATANIDFVVNTLHASYRRIKNPSLYRTLLESEWVTADGMPIVWTLRLLGYPIKERVTGADLFLPLLQLAEKNSWRIYFLGGKESEATSAIQKVKNEFPNLKIVGSSYPMIHAQDKPESIDKDILNDLERTKPDLLFLSFGNPKQEIWYNRNHNKIKTPFVMGIGGTLNFYQGRIKRAPHWMQKVGLEWLYRLKEEPQRLIKRYAIDAVLFSIMISPLIIFHNLYYIFSGLLNIINRINRKDSFIIINGSNKIQLNELSTDGKVEKLFMDIDSITQFNKNSLMTILQEKLLNHSDLINILKINKYVITNKIDLTIKSNWKIKLQLYLNRMA